ncbi:MAG TPA: CocE/NonD family hydrolase [Streptosporangiaceae bacterium]
MVTGEVRDGMRVEWDVPIEMGDGTVLRADVFRPVAEGRYPVIMTHGPYAKGLAFQQGYAGMWKPLAGKYPEVVAGTSAMYENWETVDPEKWVPDGYACVRVDSRGAGRSPGYLDIFSPQETRDYYDCIEWAGTQPWSSGKVGLLGISYYAANQWQVAALRPPHLAAICPWEGASDYYREFTHHGGILDTFVASWYPVQVSAVQHGGGQDATNPVTGEPIAGPDVLPGAELAANRSDPPAEVRARPLDEPYYRERSGEPGKITVPVLSAANWAHHLHTRGNFEAWTRTGSADKWLEVHGLEHFAEFYTDYGVALQKRFFGSVLKGEDTGWDRQPPVQVNARHVDGSFELRDETEWPLARTEWNRLYLDLDGGTLTREQPDHPAQAAFEALGEGLTFSTGPLDAETEITGPAAARLYVSSSTTDADLFVTIRVLDPAGQDVTFVSGLDTAGVIGVGWLRASHRATDPARSLPYRPWHPHDHTDPLTPGEIVPVDIEIWPTSVIIPAGYRLAVTIQGRDFEFPGDGPWPAVYGVPMKGNGIFLHNDPTDRPDDVYGGTTTLSAGPDQAPYVLLPFVPRGPESAVTRRGPYPA